MHCPRCGQEASKGDRFCVNCGADLRPPADERERAPRPRSAREWLPYLRERGRETGRELIGTSRNARVATLGTVLAVAVAIAAFFALREDEGDAAAPPRDGYTVAAEEICVEASRGIETATEATGGGSDPRAYARELVPPVAGWRSTFIDVSPPADRTALAVDLDAGLIQTLIEAGALARLPAEAPEAEVAAASERLDATGATLRDAIAALGLDACDGVQIGA